MIMKVKWTTEFPKEPGLYWFYGYRWGRISVGRPAKPELVLVRVQEISNGFMYVANGAFMFPKETEEPHFCKAELPEFPEIK